MTLNRDYHSTLKREKQSPRTNIHPGMADSDRRAPGGIISLVPLSKPVAATAGLRTSGECSAMHSLESPIMIGSQDRSKKYNGTLTLVKNQMLYINDELDAID
jgi:hypothetical protein